MTGNKNQGIQMGITLEQAFDLGVWAGARGLQFATGTYQQATPTTVRRGRTGREMTKVEQLSASQRKVIQAKQQNPEATNVQIAKTTGVQPGYVGIILRKHADLLNAGARA